AAQGGERRYFIRSNTGREGENGTTCVLGQAGGGEQTRPGGYEGASQRWAETSQVRVGWSWSQAWWMGVQVTHFLGAWLGQHPPPGRTLPPQREQERIRTEERRKQRECAPCV